MHHLLMFQRHYLFFIILLPFMAGGEVFMASSALAEAGAPQEQRRLAVLDFRDQASLPLFERSALADSVRGAALNTPLMVMTKDNMIALLPPDTDLESCVDDCEVEVGRTLGAHYIITGIIGRIEGRLQLLLRLYETRTGSLRGQATLNATSVGALQPQVRRAALRMLTELSPSLNRVLKDQRTLLFVRLKPKNAVVKLDGFLIPTNQRKSVSGGFIIPLKPGQHKVSAKARGFVDKRVRVSVREGEPVEADLRLYKRSRKRECYTGDCEADVFVFTKPAGAKIYIDGVSTGLVTKPSSMNPKLGSVALRVSPGKHWISAKKSPFDEASRQIKVSPGDLYNGFRDSPLTLRRARGSLSIRSEPSGALVRLNGQIIGKTPLKKKNVYARPYWVELISEGFQSREELVMVSSGRTKTLKWDLTSSTAQLEMTVKYRSSPVSGASVWLDDQKLGETDADGSLRLKEVMTGDHLLQVKHPLYVAEGESITLQPGQSVKRTFRMRGAFGYISVDTSELKEATRQWTVHQSGQALTVDEVDHELVVLWGGVNIGAESLQKVKVSAGRRWLQVRPPSGAESVFAPSSQRIEVRAGAVVKVKPVWRRHRARLTLSSGDVRSEVFIDGERVGYTPLARTLDTGPHTIELKADEYTPYRKLIWLTQAGTKSEVDFEKRTTLEVSCSPLKGLIQVDGLEVGVSPQSLDIQPGSHLISCLAKGAEVQREIELSPGQQLTQRLTISDNLLGAAFRRRKAWRQASVVTGVSASIILAAGITTLTMSLPGALQERDQAQSRWVNTLNPQLRAQYANEWAQRDTDAKNMNLLGWGLAGAGLSLGISSAITWWYHRN